MKAGIYMSILGIFLITLVSASQLTIIDEIDSFTGVKLMIKTMNGSWGDPIYPTEMQSAGRIAVIDLESSNKEAILKLILINHGEIVKEIEKGPFDLTIDNKIDLRIGAETENVTEELVNNELMNVSVETALRINSILVEDVEENVTEDVNGSSDGVTGFSISSMMNSKATPWALGFLGLIVIVAVVVIVAKVSYKKGVEAEMRDITRFSEMNKNL